MGALFQLFINGLINGIIYSLLAIGFGIVYRTTRIFHIAYAGFYTLSAYLFFTFFKVLKLPFFISLILSLFSISVSGYLIERFVYLPFYEKKSSSGVIFIASLGIYIIIVNLIALIFGNEIKIILEGVQPSYSFYGIMLTRIQIIQALIGFILILIFSIMAKKSKIIKALWAMGDEPELLISLGLPFYNLRKLAFIISSFFVFTSSLLTVIDIGTNPHVGLPALLTSVVAVIIGGIDRLSGWILGSFTIALIQSLVIWKFSANWAPLATFLILILILLLRPQGIIGTKKRIEEI